MKRYKLWMTLIALLGTALACGMPVSLTSPSQASPEPAGDVPAATQPPPAVTLSPADNAMPSGDVVQLGDFEYLGAFRLPRDGDRPRTFDYGGNAMTFNPDGDSSGADDGFPGSLFITGHERMPYGALLDGNQIAEVNIPIPVISRNVEELGRAEFLQGFQNVLAGRFTQMEEIPRVGLLYLDKPATGAKIHVAFAQHFEPDPSAPTHGWFTPNLSAPDFQGEWFIGDQSFYSTNDYVFEIPSAWAETYAQGRYIATGRFRDGGWSGMGPALFAYRPWMDDGSPAPSGTRLDETTLLLYENSYYTESLEKSLAGYQHPDRWDGGAWITTADGRSALLFAGTKSSGNKFWYGYLNPAGAELPCVDQDITDFTTCRMADGSSCPPDDFIECSNHNDFRGWWSTRFESQFILYDPAQIARVATGEIASWEPQPYASMTVDEYMFLNPSGVEEDMLGTGVQRRDRVGDVAYDRANNLLYVLELYADGAAPVVHVWRVK